MDRGRVACASALLLLLMSAPPARAQDASPKSLQERVNAAIDSGAAWLLAQQEDDGSFGAIGGAGYTKDARIHRYPGGLTALSLLALLKCDVPPDHAVIVKGFDYLRKQHRQPRYTYDTAMIILALEAHANPFKREAKRERFLRHKVSKKRKPRSSRKTKPVDLGVHLSKEDRVWMEQLVTSLLVKQRDDRAWRYGIDSLDRDKGMRGNKDMSNTQLAALALHAATRCGMEIPDKVFADTLKWLLESQEQTGPEHVIPEPGKEDADEGDARPPGADPLHARGWPYLPGSTALQEAECTGSMTAAGVASVLVCTEALTRRDSKLLEDWMIVRSETAVDDGIAWLDLHWTMLKNPGAKNYRYLYLWGLERVGDLRRRNLIGRHAWYLEGARTLVEEQKPDGRWLSWTHEPRDIISTAFALLFLDRSSLEVTTGE